jgi:hypothetical protein
MGADLMRPSFFLVVAILVTGCGDGGPSGKIEDVDAFLARVCEAAAACPGVSATQEQIEACPAELVSEWTASQLQEAERITTYTESRQACILDCIGVRICDRFGGGLSNISDSDVLEPFETCEEECAPGEAASLALYTPRKSRCRGPVPAGDPVTVTRR